LAAATAPRPADRRRNCQPRHARCQRSCLQNPTYIHSPFSASTSVPPALTSALFFLSAAGLVPGSLAPTREAGGQGQQARAHLRAGAAGGTCSQTKQLEGWLLHDIPTDFFLRGVSGAL
jgi:hypothetical protein